MQVAALHNALKVARKALDDGGRLPEPLAAMIDSALNESEPAAMVIIERARALCDVIGSTDGDGVVADILPEIVAARDALAALLPKVAP